MSEPLPEVLCTCGHSAWAHRGRGYTDGCSVSLQTAPGYCPCELSEAEVCRAEIALLRARLAKVETSRDEYLDMVEVAAARAEAECARLVTEHNTMSGWRDEERERADRLAAERDEMDHERGLQASERDAALAAVAQLRGALYQIAHSQFHPATPPQDKADWVEYWADRCAERERVAIVALASTTLGAGWLPPEQVRTLMERALRVCASEVRSPTGPEGDGGYSLEQIADRLDSIDIDALLAEVKP